MASPKRSNAAEKITKAIARIEAAEKERRLYRLAARLVASGNYTGLQGLGFGLDKARKFKPDDLRAEIKKRTREIDRLRQQIEGTHGTH